MTQFSIRELSYYLDVSEQFLSHHLYHFITHSTLGFTCAMLCIYSLIYRAQSHSLFGAWTSNIFGVFLHELAHAIIGALLLAKPSKFIMIPKAVELSNGKKSYILGQVECSNLRWYNRFPTAMAPLLLFGIALYLEKHYWSFPFVQKTLGYLCLYLYLQITLITNAIPSSTDFKEGFKNPFGLLLWFIILISLVIFKYNY